MMSCCCDEAPASCDIYSDTFATNLLATKWIQVAGSWSVSGGYLVPSAVDDLIVAVDEDATTPSIYGQYVSLPVFLGDSPAKIRLILDYVDDNNYHFATALCGPTVSTVEVGKRVGGVDTVLSTNSTSYIPSISAGGQKKLECCFDAAGRIRATLTVYSFGAKIISVSKTGETWLGGRKAGVLAEVYAADLKLGQFIFKHLTRGPGDICATCGVECETQTGSPLVWTTFCDDAYPRPDAVVVDLGATGITDGSCDCDWITGAFVCDHVTGSEHESFPCGLWRYYSGPHCVASPDGCNPSQNIFFRIEVQNQINFAFPMQRRFEVRIHYFGPIRNPACPDGTNILVALYHTPWTTDPEHCSFPAPLAATTTVSTGYTVNNGAGRCGGLLPTSVTLSA